MKVSALHQPYYELTYASNHMVRNYGWMCHPKVVCNDTDHNDHAFQSSAHYFTVTQSLHTR